jgi:GGDEF domain-containing protein
VVIARDITEKYKSDEVIWQYAYFDSLTLLPRRLLSLDRFLKTLEKAKQNAEKVAVLFSDLDDFKKVGS